MTQERLALTEREALRALMERFAPFGDRHIGGEVVLVEEIDAQSLEARCRLGEQLVRVARAHELRNCRGLLLAGRRCAAERAEPAVDACAHAWAEEEAEEAKLDAGEHPADLAQRHVVSYDGRYGRYDDHRDRRANKEGAHAAQSRRSDSRGVIGRQKRPHEQSQHEQTSVGEMHTLFPSHTIVVAAQPLSRIATVAARDRGPSRRQSSSTHRQKQAKATTQVTRIEVASVGKMQSSTSAMAGGISSQLNSPGHSRGESNRLARDEQRGRTRPGERTRQQRRCGGQEVFTRRRAPRARDTREVEAFLSPSSRQTAG